MGINHPDVIATQDKIDMINLMFKLQGDDTLIILKNFQKDINIAASNGDIKTVEFLLKNGDDVNDKNIDGRTPLHIAINNAHVNLVHF